MGLWMPTKRQLSKMVSTGGWVFTLLVRQIVKTEGIERSRVKVEIEPMHDLSTCRRQN